MRYTDVIIAVAVLGVGRELEAQTAAEHIQMAIAAQAARDPAAGLRHAEAALALDSTSYEATWRAGELAMDVGKQTPDSVKSPARDSLYAQAEVYGRRAVALDPSGPDGHFVLAAAIGRASMTKSSKERVRRAGEVRAEALRVLELDPAHHKTMHLMGRWNAEIMRLSGFTRFFAKTFLGGKIFNAASWDSALVYMNKAVELSPDNIYHHLDLAEIYIDLGRYAEARIHLNQAVNLTIVDVLDPLYQERAAFLLKRIEGKKDRES